MRALSFGALVEKTVPNDKRRTGRPIADWLRSHFSAAHEINALDRKFNRLASKLGVTGKKFPLHDASTGKPVSFGHSPPKSNILGGQFLQSLLGTEYYSPERNNIASSAYEARGLAMICRLDFLFESDPHAFAELISPCVFLDTHDNKHKIRIDLEHANVPNGAITLTDEKVGWLKRAAQIVTEGKDNQYGLPPNVLEAA